MNLFLEGSPALPPPNHSDAEDEPHRDAHHAQMTIGVVPHEHPLRSFEGRDGEAPVVCPDAERESIREMNVDASAGGQGQPR